VAIRFAQNAVRSTNGGFRELGLSRMMASERLLWAENDFICASLVTRSADLGRNGGTGKKLKRGQMQRLRMNAENQPPF